MWVHFLRDSDPSQLRHTQRRTVPPPPPRSLQEPDWRSTEVMQPPPLCFHSMSLTPLSSHIPRMLRSSGDKVSTAVVTTRCNRYPSPQPPPPHDANPPTPRFIIWWCVCGMLGNINTTKYNSCSPVSLQPAPNTNSSVSKLKRSRSVSCCRLNLEFNRTNMFHSYVCWINKTEHLFKVKESETASHWPSVNS